MNSKSIWTASVIIVLSFFSQPVYAQVVLPIDPLLAAYPPVTSEQLLKPAEGDWKLIRRTYDGWAYSPLKQINASNVAKLKPVWSFATGVINGHQAPPIINGGVMFISTPGNQVLALDAKTGNQLWRYKRPLAEDAIVLHPTNRGVALLGDKVYFASGDAVLVAINAKTGKEAWATKVAENKDGYYMSLAPLVAEGKVMVGVSGGELGIRGFIAAYDAVTGKESWKTHTIPAPGEPGSETWPAGGTQWKTGGGSVWVTGNYDSETKTAYWGIGNAGPWMGDQRPGDNLYTAATMALDVNTGAIKGHFQYTPNESYDWDEVSPPILIDFKRNGKEVRGLVNVSRSGYLYFLNREKNGKIGFVDGQPYVNQTAFKGLDANTGRPFINPDQKPSTGKSTFFCPSLWGGKDWPPGAFNPETRMLYIPTNDNLCSTITAGPVTYKPGERFTHGGGTQLHIKDGATFIGEVQAWNVDTGKKAWSVPFAKSPNWGPILTTAGGLVFSGGTNDRKFRAFDATTGKILWEQVTPSGITAMPASYTVDGKQYIAVQSGWGIDPRSKQLRLNELRPGQFPPVPEGGSIWVYALD